MSRSLTPIPTTFDGRRFESRLEARWAKALKLLGFVYDYEPDGYRLTNGLCYLPDFWLPQVQMFAEVKPNDDRSQLVLTDEARKKAVGLAIGTGKPVIILDGPPRETNHWAIWPDPMDPVGWDWMDVWLFESHAFHLTEGRLWGGAGLWWPAHSDDVALCSPGGPLHPAVEGALSAKFHRTDA